MGTLIEAVPEALRSLQRWVCADGGSKRPMLCFGDGAASVSNPSTWGTFEQAAACVESGAREYAGFVFADDGLVGIDIDGAFGPDGMLSPGAVAAIRACRSYTEVSKSGRGIHIICRATLPFRGRANGAGWEIYRDARYFVITGRTVMYREVADAQEAVDAIVAERFSDVQRDGFRDGRGPRIWSPEWGLDGNGRVRVEPLWSDVPSGSRHLSLVSYCGQLWGQGCPERQMLPLALRQNARHLKPPLPEDEVAQVVRSVTRYRR